MNEYMKVCQRKRNIGKVKKFIFNNNNNSKHYKVTILH